MNKQEFATVICANCGYGLSDHSIADNPPLCLHPPLKENLQHTFYDSGIKALEDAAPEMYEALYRIEKSINTDGYVSQAAFKLLETALKKAKPL